MSKRSSYARLGLIIVALALLLLACRTVDLIAGNFPTPTRAATRVPTRPAPTKTVGTPRPLNETFAPVGVAKCAPGDAKESYVIGTITENNQPLEAQLVQASAGPGGEPISDYPAVTDGEGHYKVTLVCDGKACNGAFWIWLVDEEFRQVSPFIKFTFDDRCRRGLVDFKKQ